jgi:phosphate transport system protein
MPRKEFQADLDALREDVIAMGETVLDRFEKATTALTTGDDALAREVTESDDEINDLYLALEGDCIGLFALQQPVASDLRFVAASFKVLTDLERVGDLSQNLAGYALAADDADIGVDLAGTADETSALLADALDAYEHGDAATCRAVAARDDEVDAMCRAASERVVRDLIAGDADAWDVERRIDDVSHVLLAVRDIERVGDHGVNVAARTLYAVENDDDLIY